MHKVVLQFILAIYENHLMSNKITQAPLIHLKFWKFQKILFGGNYGVTYSRSCKVVFVHYGRSAMDYPGLRRIQLYGRLSMLGRFT